MKVHTLKNGSPKAHQKGPYIITTQSMADSLGIPREISRPFCNDVQKWIRCTGIECTVRRLKDIKIDAVRAYAGQKMVGNWIAHNREKTRFRGSPEMVYRWMMRGPKYFSKGLQLFMIYTRWISPCLLPAQELKFLSGVLADPTPIPQHYLDGVSRAARFYEPSKLKSPTPLAESLTSCVSKREPLPSGASIPDGVESLSTALRWYVHFIRHSHDCGFSFSHFRSIQHLLQHVIKGLNIEKPFFGKVEPVIPFCVGKIGFIQEPGYKLRAVANPSRLIQRALKPLGDELFRCLRLAPWDCTYDQKKALPFVQEALSAGRTVHSVDLKDASSYFPLELQLSVLSVLFPDDAATRDAFELCCRAPWFYKGADGDARYVSWRRGQPLGLYPSFSAAFLTHGLLLLYLNGFKYNHEFFILGDDVVILNDELHSKYRLAMAELGCLVSEEKCISSNVLAEFAGQVIIKDRSISLFKWRNPSDDSFLDIVRNVGMGMIKNLRRRQQVICNKLLEVPTQFGGLGFNPKGRPLADRVFDALSLMERQESGSYLMNYNVRLMKDMYSSLSQDTIPFSLWEGYDIDFDKKVFPHILKYLTGPFLKLGSYETLGINLFSLAPDLPLTRDGCEPNKRSLLEVLESLFR